MSLLGRIADLGLLTGSAFGTMGRLCDFGRTVVGHPWRWSRPYRGSVGLPGCYVGNTGRTRDFAPPGPGGGGETRE